MTSFNLLPSEEIPKMSHPGVILLESQWKHVFVILFTHIQSMIDISTKEYSVTLVIGPKNVGKSTYCRCLVNTLLSHFSRVAYLDIDVGQGEYATEGVLTLSTIQEPQLRSSSVPCVNEPVFR